MANTMTIKINGKRLYKYEILEEAQKLWALTYAPSSFVLCLKIAIKKISRIERTPVHIIDWNDFSYFSGRK